MEELYLVENIDCYNRTANPVTNFSLINAKKKQSNYHSIILFLSLLMMVFFSGKISAQTTLWSTGFESGNSSPTLSNGTFTTPSTGGNFAANSIKITGPSGGSKTYDGSVITNTALSFTAGKYYVVTVYSKVANATGILRIMKSLTATNNGMNAASGSDIILNSSSIYNVTSTTYTKYQVGFSVSSNESKYIGFQLYSSGVNDAQMYLDDISIVEYNTVQPESYCTPTGSLNCTLNDYISNVSFNTLSTTSTCSAGGYTNYAATDTQTTTVLKGSSYTFNLSVGNGSGTHGAGIWIDFNQNGSFSDSGEFFLVSNAINPSTTKAISIPIPAGANTGTTRMRVRYAYGTTVASGSGMSCTMSGTYGETEDYTISIANTTCIAPTQATTFVLGTKTSTSLPFT
ncbi:MAG: GEVED domain-containing protein, partial [bacterium]|nr:GEVED domain-containing protein [bacterium]